MSEAITFTTEQLVSAGILGAVVLAIAGGVIWMVASQRGEERGYSTGHQHGAIAQRHNRPGRRPIED